MVHFEQQDLSSRFEEGITKQVRFEMKDLEEETAEELDSTE